MMIESLASGSGDSDQTTELLSNIRATGSGIQADPVGHRGTSLGTSELPTANPVPRGPFSGLRRRKGG